MAVASAENRFPSASIPTIDHAWLWAAVAAVAIVGDTATTLIGLQAGAVEENPFVATLLEASGLWVFPALKLLELAVLAVLYRLAPTAWRIGVPIGALLVGGYAVANNLVVLSEVLRA